MLRHPLRLGMVEAFFRKELKMNTKEALKILLSIVIFALLVGLMLAFSTNNSENSVSYDATQEDLKVEEKVYFN